MYSILSIDYSIGLDDYMHFNQHLDGLNTIKLIESKIVPFGLENLNKYLQYFLFSNRIDCNSR